MKLTKFLAFVAITIASASSTAATDRAYYIAELSTPPRFDVYNDGQNTYLEAVRGLVVAGATADGDRYIVSGVPHRIYGILDGEDITLVRGIPRSHVGATAPVDSQAQANGAPRTEPGDAGLPSGEQTSPNTVENLPFTAGRPEMRVAPLEQWEIKAGDSLRYTLDSWCERAGYRLLWNIEAGFKSQGGHVVEGDFRKAVVELFNAIPQDLHLRVEITKNKLVIVSKGDK